MERLFLYDVLIQAIYFVPQGSDLSAITSLYILSRLLQIIGGRCIINNVAAVILNPFLTLNVRYQSEGNAYSEHNDVYPFAKFANEVERATCFAPECRGEESINRNYFNPHMADLISSFYASNSNADICFKRLALSQISSLLSCFWPFLCVGQ